MKEDQGFCKIYFSWCLHIKNFQICYKEAISSQRYIKEANFLVFPGVFESVKLLKLKRLNLLFLFE